MAKLIPPDLSRCQCEITEGYSFMTLGKPQPVRCKAKPKWIAIEKKPGLDGKRGSMSLCEACKETCEKQCPNIEFQRICETKVILELTKEEAEVAARACATRRGNVAKSVLAKIDAAIVSAEMKEG